jgi:hypothetical protein
MMLEVAMKVALFTLALALPLATSVQAQTVGGHVVVRSGPVTAAVVFGPRPVYYPERPVYGPRVVVVGSPYYGEDYWWHRGYRQVTVYYDPNRDCYYDHADPRFGFRPVVVYQRGGRYFREAEFRRDDRRDNRGNREYRDRDDHDHGNGHGYGHDRHDGWHGH